MRLLNWLSRLLRRPNSAPDGKTRLFVYGSLKRGFGLHDFYLNGQTFVGTDRIPGFIIVNLGAYPGAVKYNADDYITGEVYDVDYHTFAQIESMERQAGYVARSIVTTGNRRVWMFEYRPYPFVGTTWSLEDQNGGMRRGAKL